MGWALWLIFMVFYLDPDGMGQMMGKIYKAFKKESKK